MNVVGKVGSLISQGVYSVATPFHPFGGAVDVIVVQQEDGTYRSTPWYVRFGKFQGVLKSAEKVVSISVNGVEAGFHMYLDNSGQAYFMREVSGSNDAESNNFMRTESTASDSCTVGNFEKNTGDRQDGTHFTGKDDAIDTAENSYIATDEQASPNSLAGSSEFSNYHYGSLDEVEDMVKESDDSNSEMVLISVDGHVLTAPISSDEENPDNVQLDTPQFHLGPGEGSTGDFGPTADVWEAGFFGDISPSAEMDNAASEIQLESPKDCQDILCHEEARVVENIDCVEDSPGHEEPQGTVDVDICYKNNTRGLSNNDMFRSCLDLVSHDDHFDSQDVASLSAESDLKDESRNSTEVSSFMSITLQENNVIRESDFESDTSDSPQTKTDGLKGNDYDDRTQKNNEVYQHIKPHSSSLSGSALFSEENVETYTSEKSLDANNMSQHLGSSCIELSANDKGQSITVLDAPITEEDCNQIKSHDTKENIFRLGFEISLCGNLLRPDMGHKSAEEAFEAHRISEQEFKTSGASFIKNVNLIIRYQGKYLQWDKAAHIILGKAVFGSNFDLTPNEIIPVEHDEASKSKAEAPGVSPTVSRRWRLWPIPFRMSKSLQHSNSNSSGEELFMDTTSGLQNSNEENMTSKAGKSPRKQFIRTNIPTNEEIASLNLKEGQNMIAFSFSTRVFGRQLVDAHIYLWKWNARIVISDVDGTITKSDVLGQFMPLVGKDWTQSGVARLFSAIKENGYQLLFLSARAIVQAYLTRSFLLNLKQDGKALPSGPVVISPDGLFPSLYREVIRRAPHEFKIACLEDIKALFPSDYNPFYAGFGNRDTDELSYRKIGIPKGKIFIINPKGEVAINHCVDVKSYTSLHTLVHDMFPPTTLVEQEDYNSWNYWKMPLPSLDM